MINFCNQIATTYARSREYQFTKSLSFNSSWCRDDVVTHHEGEAVYTKIGRDPGKIIQRPDLHGILVLREDQVQGVFITLEDLRGLSRDLESAVMFYDRKKS